jgi:hypothetical protein
MLRRLGGPLAVSLALLAPVGVLAHSERPTLSPARPGSVPDPGRAHPTVLNVCKTEAPPACDYPDIQAAVNAVDDDDGTLIQIWPGTYQELPSTVPPSGPCVGLSTPYTFEQQRDCPNNTNLIGVVGKKNVTLRGMGDGPSDVLVDVGFNRHVGLRADRADGIIIQNLSVWGADEHGVYVLDLSGYLIEDVISGYSGEYGFLMFATDHGVLRDCDAFGAGDAGIYPGGAPNTPGRFSNEIYNCTSHHNVIGYSGTQGNFVWFHDNELYDNATGLTSDSETDHPNYPQAGLLFERNKVYDNNFNTYAAGSDVKVTVAVGEFLIPVGTGVFLVSGNDNLVQSNDIWDNDRFGVWLASGEGLVIGPTSDPPAAPFASSGNQLLGNRMYAPAGYPGGANSVDFGWDGLGYNNCWNDNVRNEAGDPATTDALMLPPCAPTRSPTPPIVGVPNPSNMLEQTGLAYVPQEDDGTPLACYVEDCVGENRWGPGAANARNTPPCGPSCGYFPPPSPANCGPSDLSSCWGA